MVCSRLRRPHPPFLPPPTSPAPAPRASLLVLKHAKSSPASGPLHVLCCQDHFSCCFLPHPLPTSLTVTLSERPFLRSQPPPAATQPLLLSILIIAGHTPCFFVVFLLSSPAPRVPDSWKCAWHVGPDSNSWCSESPGDWARAQPGHTALAPEGLGPLRQHTCVLTHFRAESSHTPAGTRGASGT